jgi:hypothetical protein
MEHYNLDKAVPNDSYRSRPARGWRARRYSGSGDQILDVKLGDRIRVHGHPISIERVVVAVSWDRTPR